MAADHDGVCGELLPDVLHKVDKVLGVAVCHVHADEMQLGHRRQDGRHPVKVTVAAARTDGHALTERRREGESETLFN